MQACHRLAVHGWAPAQGWATFALQHHYASNSTYGNTASTKRGGPKVLPHLFARPPLPTIMCSLAGRAHPHQCQRRGCCHHPPVEPVPPCLMSWGAGQVPRLPRG